MIDIEILSKIAAGMKDLMIEHVNDIDSAYLTCGDDSLVVTLKAKISPEADGFKVKTSISFSKGTFKDDVILEIGKKQGDLFEAPVDEAISPDAWNLTMVDCPVCGDEWTYNTEHAACIDQYSVCLNCVDKADIEDFDLEIVKAVAQSRGAYEAGPEQDEDDFRENR